MVDKGQVTEDIEYSSSLVCEEGASTSGNSGTSTPCFILPHAAFHFLLVLLGCCGSGSSWVRSGKKKKNVRVRLQPQTDGHLICEFKFKIKVILQNSWLISSSDILYLSWSYKTFGKWNWYIQNLHEVGSGFVYIQWMYRYVQLYVHQWISVLGSKSTGSATATQP